MRQISGYVLVKETSSGVPNLVVAAFDSEKSAHEIIATHNEKISLSLEDFGKRIGSVLTDADGKFILKSEDLEFQGNEPRPDLLIVIFAPEDIQTVEKPYPLPPEKRVLYISTVPRADAGAEEAFVIRLLQAQLDQFQIATDAAASDSQADGDRLANAIQSTWSFRDSLREKLKPRLLEEQKKSERVKKLAQEKVKNLSAIPLYLRDGKLRNNKFLVMGKSDLAENLKIKQDQAMTDGLKRLETRDRTLHLTLTTAELKDLGLKEEGGKLSGKVDSEKLAEKVRSLINGVDLVRLRGLDNPSPDELERKYLTNKPNPNTDKTDSRAK